MTLIGVIGKGRNCPGALRDLAFDVGTLLANVEGVTVVTGGLGGVMESAAMGAYTHGGRTLSLIPAGRESEAHRYTDLALHTGLSEPYRNALLGSIADAALVLPGSHGTLQEATILLDADRPLVMVGDHFGWLTADLPSPFAVDPVEAVGMLCGMLGLPVPAP